MKEQIKFREFKEQDYPALEHIVRKTWHYDDFCSPRTSALLAKVYLSSCLTNQTYTQVAVVDGTAAGIIMGKNIQTHKCPLKYRLRAVRATVSLLLSKEGRAVSKIFGNISGIDRELLEKCPEKYKGEVAFFAVDPAYRGKGLGKSLFHSLLQYMEQEEIPSFYLFTDTSCNYGFYEHQGMKRCGEREQSFKVGGNHCTMHFFVYEYRI